MNPRHWLISAAGALPLVWLAFPSHAPNSSDPKSEARIVATRHVESAQPARLLFGLCALQDISIGHGAVIDDTASPLEHYLEGRAMNTGTAVCWSFGEIFIDARAGSNPTVVVGHARPGWKGGVTLTKGAFVTGSIEPVELPESLPTLRSPMQGSPPDLEGGAEPHRLTGDAMRLGYVRLTGTQELHLVGPLDAEVNRLECFDQSRVVCDTRSGPIQLRITTGLRMAQGTTWDTNGADVSKFALLAGTGTPKVEAQSLEAKSEEERRAERLRRRLRGDTDGNEGSATIEFNGAGRFVGLLYAPFSDVRLPASLPFQGVLMANRLTLDPGARATTDRAALEAWEQPNEARSR